MQKGIKRTVIKKAVRFFAFVENAETGKEVKSVERIMAKLQSPTAALEALTMLITK